MKKYALEIFLSPIFLLLSVYIFSFLFSFEILEPIRQTINDFDITDIGLQISPREKIADTNIVIVDIGRFNKKKLYYLLKTIIQYNPKVIGISETVNEKNYPIYNDSIANICKQFPAIVFASILKDYNENAKMYFSIERAWGKYLLYAKSGFKNLPFGMNKNISTVREFRLSTTISKVKEYSFAYQIVSIFDTSSSNYLLSRNNEFERIYFSGNTEIFTHLNSKQVLLNDFDNQLFDNKIVLIGHAPFHNAVKQLDYMYFTPFSSLDEGRPLPDMYEIVLQANIIKMINDRKYYDRVPLFSTIIFTLLLVYFNMYIYYLISDKIVVWYEILSNILFLLQSIVILVLVIVLYINYQIYADLNYTLLALAIIIIVFEAYRDSVIPFAKIFINRFRQRSSK